jgi:hypothetical protein
MQRDGASAKRPSGLENESPFSPAPKMAPPQCLTQKSLSPQSKSGLGAPRPLLAVQTWLGILDEGLRRAGSRPCLNALNVVQNLDICAVDRLVSPNVQPYAAARSVTRRTAIVSAYTLQIICLANSRKMLGRCVAGKRIGTNSTVGKWIRPVSERPEKELSVEERHYEGRIEPSLLDVINIAFLRSDPHDYQPENYLIDANYYWARAGNITYAQARRLLDPPQSDLWGLSSDTSYHGQYDRVNLSNAASFWLFS